MRLPFQRAAPERAFRQPQPACLPALKNSSVSALYRAARVGGDFYDFLLTDSSRLVFLLLDIAGKREQALDIAAAVQDRFRELVPKIFHGEDINESDATAELVINLNRVIMQTVGGVRCAPAFVGCYREAFGTLTYVNAGHTPALLKDADGVTQLEANGLPMGLFSHGTYDARFCVLRPGAALVLISKGLVESRSGSTEFGIERLQQWLLDRQFPDAQTLCAGVLDAVQAFIEQGKKGRRSGTNNDTTTVALVRAATGSLS